MLADWNHFEVFALLIFLFWNVLVS